MSKKITLFPPNMGQNLNESNYRVTLINWHNVWNVILIIFLSCNQVRMPDCLCDTSQESYRVLTMPACPASGLGLLLLLLCELLGGWVLTICPSECSCSRGHRVVDCSSRGLTKLPSGLQHNIRVLNLSFNRWSSCDAILSKCALQQPLNFCILI